MDNRLGLDDRLRRFKLRRLQALAFGAAVSTVLWLPGPGYAQSTATPERQTVPSEPAGQNVPGDEATRRDLARFNQFLDSHPETDQALRRKPSLISDSEFLRSHPELDTYLQDHPSVKQEISEHPDTFMRLEDLYTRDHAARDRDAGGQDRDADRREPMNGDRNQDRDGDRRGAVNRDAMSFDRFLDQHREIAEQVRKAPSLLDDRRFVDNHPALQAYLQQNPGVGEQLREDPNAFMRQVDLDNRNARLGDHAADGQDRDADRRGMENFDRFLSGHREIAEQVRKDPSLLDDRRFVDNHPALQAYLQQNPGVHEQLRQDPNAFMQQARMDDPGVNGHDRDPMHDHMADFGGFLDRHSDIQKDLNRNPSVVKDHQYLEDHAELNDYLNAHPDVRDDLMANPMNFVRGAQQFNNPGTAGGTGTGVKTGTGGAAMNPAPPTHVPNPNQ